MLRLGIGLTLRGGREAALRLAATAASVALAVGILLGVLADLHAFEATNRRACWQCTTQTRADGDVPSARIGADPPTARTADDWPAERPAAGASGADPPTGSPAAGRLTQDPDRNPVPATLWNYRQDFFDGRPVDRLDLAPLAAGAPLIPGLPRMPAPGEYFASPALAARLAAAPPAELADRFPGHLAGLLGPAALAGPDDLAIVVGRSGAELAGRPGTIRVAAVETAPRPDSATDLYRLGFGLAALALVVPLLTLIGTATRLSAARREQRFAAIRLAGGTPAQVDLLASVEALVGAVVGTAAGFGVFALLRPLFAGTAVTGSRYFSFLVHPGPVPSLAVLLGVPAGAVLAARHRLRRVRRTPLDVGRRVSPPAPRGWRLLPLGAGAVLLAVAPFVPGPPSAEPWRRSPSADLATPLDLLGVALVLVGLVIAGPWLAMGSARLVAVTSRGAAGLLSARRLADDPTAAGRATAGLVLALFAGTLVAGVVPAVTAGMRAVGDGRLTDVLRVVFVSQGDPRLTGGPPAGLPASQAADLLARLRRYPVADLLPVYADPGGVPTVCVADHECVPTSGTIPCAALAAYPVFGVCASGVASVDADFGNLLGHDDPASIRLPFVGAATPAGPGDPAVLAGRPLAALLVRAADPAGLERIRTLLSGYAEGTASATAPRTFGEGVAKRAAAYRQVEQAAAAVVVLTLVTAGCSLAIAVGGGLVDRRRAFALLRMAGTPMATLYRVVLWEAAAPLAVAALLAVGAALGTALSVTSALAVDGRSRFTLPGAGYAGTVGAGLLAAFTVIAATLPLSRRVSRPESVRFE